MDFFSFFFRCFYFLPKSLQHIVSKAFYRVKTGKGVKFYGFSTFSGDVEIGDYSYVCGDSHISNTTIGKYCCIAKRVSVVDGQHPFESFSSYNFFDQVGSPLRKSEKKQSNNYVVTAKHTYIGNDVWIGENVGIKGGVTIGNGAVIGTHSMVTKDIPPYAIAVGNPARIIRYRFGDEKIQLMENIKWWDWTLDEIYTNFIGLSQFDAALADKDK